MKHEDVLTSTEMARYYDDICRRAEVKKYAAKIRERPQQINPVPIDVTQEITHKQPCMQVIQKESKPMSGGYIRHY